MKISRTKFVLVFLVLTFGFQFITNSVLGPKISLFPRNGEWYPGGDSSTGWKSTLAAIIYPIKFVLIEPLSFWQRIRIPRPRVVACICFVLDDHRNRSTFSPQ